MEKMWLAFLAINLVFGITPVSVVDAQETPPDEDYVIAADNEEALPEDYTGTDIIETAEQDYSGMEYIGAYEVTAYSYNEGGGENYYTAGGYEPTPWYTAAAPEDIPFGTVIYIDGVGTFQVQDRGGFPSNVIDIHVGYDDPEIFGRQTHDVYIVQE